jgi:hypothetical protein
MPNVSAAKIAISVRWQLEHTRRRSLYTFARKVEKQPGAYAA